MPVFWTGPPANGGGVSTFYFDDAAGSPAQAVTAVNNALVNFAPFVSNSLSASCGTDIDILDVATGTLQATTSFAPAVTPGSDVADPLPPVVQGLMKLTTTAIVNGRVIRGRIFLPGATEARSTAGVPTAGYLAAVAVFATGLIGAASTDWTVWSQTNGSQHSVASGVGATKWSFLKSRRD